MLDSVQNASMLKTTLNQIFKKNQRFIQNPVEHLRWSFLQRFFLTAESR